MSPILFKINTKSQSLVGQKTFLSIQFALFCSVGAATEAYGGGVAP